MKPSLRTIGLGTCLALLSVGIVVLGRGYLEGQKPGETASAISAASVASAISAGSVATKTTNAGATTAHTPQPATYFSIDVNDPELLKTGLRVYQTACASCHGSDFSGQENWRRPGADGMLPAPPHDRTGHSWHHPDRVLFDVVKLGPGYNVPGYRSRMKGYADILSDEEIRAVNSYIASQWPADILAAQRGINADWLAKR